MIRADGPVARWVPVVGWAAAIFLMSAQPSIPAPSIPHLDKVLHALTYALLALLLARAWLPALAGRPPAVRWALVVLATFGYGISDEVHQAFVPGRACELGDALADLAGALLVATVSLAARRPPR